MGTIQLDLFAPLPPEKRSVSPAPTPVKTRPTVLRAGRDSELESIARDWLRALGAVNLAQALQVHWNPRMRSTAGSAFPTRKTVHLNPRLLEFGPQEVDRTLRHEMAHLLAQDRAGRRRIQPHGAEWAQACADLGLPGESRTHQLPLPSRRLPRPYVYRCPACRVEIRRARPLRKAAACKTCCDRHNRGHYDVRFRLVRRKVLQEES